ncbi:PREDICTED: B3 domain-containing protein Os12g0591400-like [Ipomoea nil]|uniref:B3 domain-containing protein Os12g0591400-like n=1 Tax=Ipomoea nil TaxID=35883 RepID=UPI000901D427|nr:PREDICTED: B3 domain-containing protein Os12g0591400-like [Ipomoea nil]
MHYSGKIMETKPFRRNGERPSRPNSSENRPQFYKIILAHELTRLRFPLKFARRHGRNLPKVARLEVPTGQVSKIQVVHDSQGRIWLAKGWEEFTKNYSIREDYFLVFRYDGESHFHVLIFDNNTASEIEYPQIIVSHGGVESLEDLSQKCGPNKRKRQEDQTGSFCNRFNHVRVKVENSADDDEGSPPLMTPKISSGEKQRLVKTKTEMGSAYERAKAFKSKNPFHISVMYPSYVSSGYSILTIPLAFAKEHFLGQSSNNDLVLVSGGRSWPAKCTRSGNNARIFGWKAFVVDNKLKVGDVCILEIMKSKKLSVNIIVFPADEIDETFQFRHHYDDLKRKFDDQRPVKPSTAEGDQLVAFSIEDDQNCLHSPGKIMAPKPFRRNGGGLSRRCSSEIGPQIFNFIIFSHEPTRLRLPLKFARRHGRNLPKVACLEVPTGQVSKIQVVHDSQGRIWLDKGWEEFTKNYSIRDGHFLVFRYDGESHFHVLIFDKTASEIEYPEIVSHGGVESLEDLSQKCGPNKRKRQEDQTGSFCNRFNHVRVQVENSADDDEGSPPLMTPKISTGEKKSLVKTTEMGSAYERAKAFKSKNPFHISVMYPYYVSSKGSRLNIPLAFAKKHFLGQSSNNDLVLVSGGRSWPAKCARSVNNARIFGWKAFVVDNKLKVGDVCILEIMKSKKLTVNIIVFPADAIDD